VPGFFRITDYTDLDVGTRHIRHRAAAMFRRCRALERAAAEEFNPFEVGRLFDLEAVP
jgi:hypothetical protein